MIRTVGLAASLAMLSALLADAASAQTIGATMLAVHAAASGDAGTVRACRLFRGGSRSGGFRHTPPPAPGEAKPEEKKEEEKKDEENKDEEKEWRLFHLPGLEANRIDVHGWIDQGITFNPDSPGNQFNGPIGYNDRSNDYMLSQVYLVMERLTKTDDCECDVGGRVDLLYGEDHRFVAAHGLDSDFTSSK